VSAGTSEIVLRRQYVKLCDLRGFDDPGVRADRRQQSRHRAADTPAPQALGILSKPSGQGLQQPINDA
jgi:hypothetical protein